jgi:AraC-like DNA-binding protein
MWKKSGIRRRFLLSYICVLIPIMILNLWIVNTMHSERADQVRSRVITQLKNAGERLDEQYTRYRNSAIVLANSPELVRYKMLGSVQNALEGIKLLHKLVNYYPELFDVFIAYDSERIFSSKGFTSSKVYYEKVLGLDTSGVKKTRKSVEYGQPSIQRNISRHFNVLYSYHYPVRTYYNNINVSVSFIIDEDILIDTMRTSIVDTNPYIFLAPLAEKQLILVNDDINRRLLNSGYVRVSADSTFFSMLVYYNERDLFASETLHWIIWYLVIAVIMVAMIALSFVLSRYQYKPIAKLVKRAQSDKMPVPAIPKHKNEYEYIDDYIDRISRESEWLSFQLEKERQVVCQQSATLIFNGLVRTRKQIISRMDFSGISLEDDYYAIIALSSADQNAIETVKLATVNYFQYETEANNRYELYLLIGLQSNDINGEERRTSLELLPTNKTIRIGVSNVYNDLEMIAQAREEAAQSLAMTPDGGNPFLWHNQDDKKKGLSYDALIQAISSRNSEGAMNLLAQMRDRASNPQEELTILEGVQRAIISASVLLQMEEQEGTNRNILSSIGSRLSEHHLDRWKVLGELILELCKKNDHNDVIASALMYIRKRFTDNTLTLETVADHCQVSSAYLSRLFKRRMGIGYIDYVTELRMHEACHLLTGTTLPISEIALRVGYLNTSSFRKKFKLVTGMNLSEYRNKRRKGC